MGIITSLKTVLTNLFRSEPPSVKESIYQNEPVIEEVHSLWDYIKFNTQSQAHHICQVLGFEEWVAMDEILRRIKELFEVQYKNERSLYPYIKTLVDCGLLETSGFSGKKQWRKRDLVIKIQALKEEKEMKKQTIHSKEIG